MQQMRRIEYNIGCMAIEVETGIGGFNVLSWNVYDKHSRMILVGVWSVWNWRMMRLTTTGDKETISWVSLCWFLGGNWVGTGWELGRNWVGTGWNQGMVTLDATMGEELQEEPQEEPQEESEGEMKLLLGSKYSSSSSEVVFLTLFGADAITVPSIEAEPARGQKRERERDRERKRQTQRRKHREREKETSWSKKKKNQSKREIIERRAREARRRRGMMEAGGESPTIPHQPLVN